MPGQVRQVQCTEYTSTTAVLGTLALRIAYAACAPCVLYYMTLAAWHWAQKVIFVYVLRIWGTSSCDSCGPLKLHATIKSFVKGEVPHQSFGVRLKGITSKSKVGLLACVTIPIHRRTNGSLRAWKCLSAFEMPSLIPNIPYMRIRRYDPWGPTSQWLWIHLTWNTFAHGLKRMTLRQPVQNKHGSLRKELFWFTFCWRLKPLFGWFSGSS